MVINLSKWQNMIGEDDFEDDMENNEAKVDDDDKVRIDIAVSACQFTITMISGLCIFV